MAKSKKKQPKRYLFEEVLAFLKHNDGKSFNYKQLGAAMEIDNESDRFFLLETLEELKHQGFVIAHIVFQLSNQFINFHTVVWQFSFFF